MSKRWLITEETNIFEYIKNEEIKIDDTVEIITYNQEGYRQYKVILNEKKEKDIMRVSVINLDIINANNYDVDDDDVYGCLDN